MHLTSSVFARTRMLLPVIVVGLLLGGCSDSAKKRMSLLEQENLDLRSRNQQLELALTDAETQRQLSASEVRALRAENDQLRLSGSQGGGGSTGFEGLAGVNSSVSGGGEVVVDVAGDVLFASGKVDLKSSARQTLDSVASVINDRYSGRVIRIAGHTDSDPIKKSKWKTNERLSAERALAVEEYLAKKGVDAKRMYVAAFGSSNPKSSKKDSRRVEIVIMAGNAS